MKEYRLSDERYEEILAVKRDIHMHPELSRREHRTTGKIKEYLSRFKDIELLPIDVPTGVLARIRGTGEGPEIMLRADIDALPQNEEYDSPWRSVEKGCMHGCGHDMHTAALLGAAAILQEARDDGALKGTVWLLFQPAEETGEGAKIMIDAGLFDIAHPAMCFGMHNWPSVRTGQVVCRQGAIMAAKHDFEVTIKGHGGHAAMPHLNVDPIVCAAAVVQSLQTVVSRNISPLDSVVLSIRMIHGGNMVNVVVDNVTIIATVRSLSDAALDRVMERVGTIARNTAMAYECGCDISWNERIPAVSNTEEMTAIACRCAEAAGCEVVEAPPAMVSEDFSLYTGYVPTFFYWTGSTAPGDKVEDLHRPLFHTDDEALRYAAALYAASAIYAGR